LVDKQVTLHVTPATAPTPAYGDPDKVRRAMSHLLDNAIKFTPKGGTVAVRTTSRPGSDGSVETLVFEVADSGPGVPESHQEKILEVFFQADGSVTRQYGGVGLGLAFARRVAEAHGGRVQIESPPREPWIAAELASTPLTGTLVRLELIARPTLPAPPTDG
jgi:signal transduction histidine kinase